MLEEILTIYISFLFYVFSPFISLSPFHISFDIFYKLMFRSEWREFPSAPCLARKKNLMTARVSMLLKSRASRHASELVSLLVGLRTYQQPGSNILTFNLIYLFIMSLTLCSCFVKYFNVVFWKISTLKKEALYLFESLVITTYV